MFDHLLESSHRDDSNKWSNIGFGQEIKELASIEVNFTHLIWCSDDMFLHIQVMSMTCVPYASMTTKREINYGCCPVVMVRVIQPYLNNI